MSPEVPAPARDAPLRAEARPRPLVPFGLEDRRQQRRVRFVRALFVVGLVLWTSLAAWWALYFYRATLAVRESRLETLSAVEMLYAQNYMLAPGETEFARTLPASLAVQALPLDEEALEFPHVSLPLGDAEAKRALVIAPAERHRLQGQTRSKMLMLAGEGSFLVGLLFVIHLAMYRMLVGEWRLNRQRESFVHAVTHELKSPIAGLRALLQSFESLELSAEERRSFTGLGLAELRRLDAMVGNILLSTRLEGRAFTPQIVTVDLRAVLERLAERKQLQFSERGGTLTLEVSADTARFDAEALETVLENLLENALKYTGDTPHVAVRTVRAGARVQVEVRDDGIGFDPEDRLKVFEKFYRTPEGEQKAAKGTGLGLFIARGLARACGGDLTAHSDGHGRGARFVLEMPAEA